jgi:hypothetical protein
MAMICLVLEAAAEVKASKVETVTVGPPDPPVVPTFHDQCVET